MELMGDIPRSIVISGKYSSEFFNRKGLWLIRHWIPQRLTPVTRIPLKGELRHITKLRYWPLEAVLHDKYLFPKAEADAIASFLTPMLRLHPDRRAKASELIHHNWMDGVLVQGEVDVIRRAEEDEIRKKELVGTNGVDGAVGAAGVLRGGAGRHHRKVSALEQSEVDAMKPVDDIVVLGDTDHSRSPPPGPQAHGYGHGHAHAHVAPRLNAAPVSSSSGAKENAGVGRVANASGTTTTTTAVMMGSDGPGSGGTGTGGGAHGSRPSLDASLLSSQTRS